MYILHDVWILNKEKNEQETQQERSNRKSQRIPDGFFVCKKKKHMLNQHKQTELRGQHVRYNVIMSTKNVH